MPTSKDYHAILTKVYSKHNPQKIAEIPQLLNKYKGNEDALLAEVFKKYNVSGEEKNVFNSDQIQPAEPVTETYSHFGSNEPRRSVKWVVIGLAIVALFGSVIWLLNAEQNNSNTKAVKDTVSNSALAKSSRTEYLSIEALQRIAGYNASNTETITDLLNDLSYNWQFKGHDDANTIWAQSESGDISKDGSAMLCYFNAQGIWEYTFFDKQAFGTLSSAIEAANTDLVSQQKEGGTTTKTYKSGAFVFQTCAVRLTDPNKPYGYKVLLLPTQQTSKTVASVSETNETPVAIGECYAVTADKAYFYKQPNGNAQGRAYLIKGETFTPLQVQNGFVFVDFFNKQGKETTGWLQSSNAAPCTETNSKHIVVGKGYWPIGNTVHIYNQPSNESNYKTCDIVVSVVPEKLQNGFAYITCTDMHGNRAQGWIKQSQLQEPED